MFAWSSIGVILLAMMFFSLCLSLIERLEVSALCRLKNLVWCLTLSYLSLRVDSVCLRFSKVWVGLPKSCLWELVCVSGSVCRCCGFPLCQADRLLHRT